MKYLIDTHTFLWFTNGSEEISEKAKVIIENREHEILISIASLWEMPPATQTPGKNKINRI